MTPRSNFLLMTMAGRNRQSRSNRNSLAMLLGCIVLSTAVQAQNVKKFFEPTNLCCVLLLAVLSTTATAQSNDFTVSALLNAAAPGLVELVDLYPTLAELVDLPKPAHDLEGLSFVPLLENPTRQWKSAAFSQSRREGHDGLTIRTDRYRYTQWYPLEGAGATMQELYDLQQDPMEFNNLADEPEHEGRVAELSQRLAQGWQGALPEGLAD